MITAYTVGAIVAALAAVALWLYFAGARKERSDHENATLRTMAKINQESRKAGIRLDGELVDRRRAVREWMQGNLRPAKGGDAGKPLP